MEPGESLVEWADTMHLPFLFTPVTRVEAKRTTPAPVPEAVKGTLRGIEVPIASGTYGAPAITSTLYDATMGTVPAEVPVDKLRGVIDVFMGIKLSFDNRATPLVIYVPIVEVTGPDVVLPVFLYARHLRTVQEVVPVVTAATRVITMSGVFTVPFFPSVWREREVRPMVLIPVLTPVVVPVTYFDFVVPRLAGPVAVAIITRRS